MMCTELEDIDWANTMYPMNTVVRRCRKFFATVFQETIDQFVATFEKVRQQEKYLHDNRGF